ncbi:MAG: hypothetical protein R3182_14415, partial [Draconibacterium sp.]|nr:hypothetical protein [Draconibacterium sp.]
TDAIQQRVTGTVRTSETSGYFIDIFRSARKDGNDKKHEYLFHGQGAMTLLDLNEEPLLLTETDELSSVKGDLKGYDYFSEKYGTKHNEDFIARFNMPSFLGGKLNVNFWMEGNDGREVFSVKAPYSRAIREGTGPKDLYHKPLPTLVVRQNGEARTKPFVAVIDAFNESEGKSVERVGYFQPNNENQGFIGLKVKSKDGRYDLIFNDENPETLNRFKHGEIKGAYGVISKIGDKFHSMLLNNGTLFEHGSVKVEMKEKGDVLIQSTSDGIEIESSLPFTLTIPDKDFEFETGRLINSETGMEVNGKITTKENKRLATFELPALKRIKLQLR